VLRIVNKAASMSTEATAEGPADVPRTVEQRVETYNSERKTLARIPRDILGEATNLLASLGKPTFDLPSANAQAPRNRRRAMGSKPSTACRKEMSAAQKARWAAREKQ
jgi:hypothetical protein